jgi:hypothetical protein
LVQVIWVSSGALLTPKGVWFENLDDLFLIPNQQIGLKVLLFLLLPLFLPDILELSVMLSYNDYSWV